MRLLVVILGVLVVVGLALWVTTASPPEHVIGSYVTSLRGRSASQIHNVRLAVRRINNTVIKPGAVFSFNKAVDSWTADAGYVKAPVSYNGELVRDWGGGVCQASTTLYNAALLAGLEIVERHRHHWPARYAPIGRDAAVAYDTIDLKFRNNLRHPVRVVGRISRNSVVFEVLSHYKPNYRVSVETSVRSIVPQSEVLYWCEPGSRRQAVVNRGHPGFDVVTVRMFEGKRGARVEIVSEDHYPAMHRVIRVAAR